jgi:hypothetical protein
MNNLENLLKETNLRIDESLASVFTKDDVKTLLYTFAEKAKNQLDLEDQDHLEQCIRRALDDERLIDYDSAEFTIEYNNTLTLQHINLCEDDIVDAILDNLRKNKQ